MDLFAACGLGGSLLVIFAWAFEAFEAVGRHKSLIDLKFAAIYIAAMSLLIIHTVAIGDQILVFLNSTILMIAIFEVAYTIHVKNVRKGRGR